jgi:hypothetical protein
LGNKSQFRYSAATLSDIRNLLDQTGLKIEGLDRIRLARGVVGKASYVAAALLAVFGIIAFELRDTNALVGLGALAAVTFLAYLFCVLRFATRNPGLALLEGAELIQWRQMDMAAKDMPVIPVQPNVAAPVATQSSSES